MATLKTGIIGTYLKENEKRVAIHPDHFSEISPELRRHLFFEKGYGKPFGIDDHQIAEQMGGVAARDEILTDCDVTILSKPLAADLKQMKKGASLWGWAHCVQQREITQAAIDRRLTLITWEGMNRWDQKGNWLSHTFARNNEIAGYAGVIHALGLTGTDGGFGPKKKAAVINFGSVGQGAVKALVATGFVDITLYVLQKSDTIKYVPPEVKVAQMTNRGNGFVSIGDVPFINELAQMDVIVNGMLQNPTQPLNYMTEDGTDQLKPGALIVDVSCDEGMGFPFARPTSFKEPMITVKGTHYYAVDHTPSYLWNAASWEISKALLPYLATVMAGPLAWEQDETIRRAIEIKNGAIFNPAVLAFQNREAEYPHRII